MAEKRKRSLLERIREDLGSLNELPQRADLAKAHRDNAGYSDLIRSIQLGKPDYGPKPPEPEESSVKPFSEQPVSPNQQPLSEESRQWMSDQADPVELGTEQLANLSDLNKTPRGVSGVRPEVMKHVAKKYGFEGDLSDEALKQAQADARHERNRNLLYEGGAGMGAALSGIPKDEEFWKRQNASAGQGVADLQERRAGFIQNRKVGQDLANDDPESIQNKAFRQSLKAVMPQVASMEGFEGVTLTNAGPFEKMASLYVSQQNAAAGREQAAATREQTLALKQKEGADRDNRAITSNLLAHSQAISKDQVPDLASTIDRVEGRIGALEQHSGKDLPGFGRVKSMLPNVVVDYMDPDGAALRQDVEAIASIIRHGKYGSALTQQESARFLTEAGTGRFRDPAAAVRFLQRAKEELRTGLKQREAAQRPEAMERFRGEGGLTSDSLYKTDRAPVKNPPSSGPQPGQSEDGFRFLGGDPADPANWEQE